MLIPLGILAASGGAPADFELISTQIVSGTTTFKVDFASIPQTYKHLQIRATVRGNSTSFGATGLQFNGVTTGANFAWHKLYGNGSNVVSTGGYSNEQYGPDNMSIPYVSSTANAYAAQIYDILDYTNTNKNKTVRALSGFAAGGNFIELHSGVYKSTTAITSVQIVERWGYLVAGSRVSLYGIKG